MVGYRVANWDTPLWVYPNPTAHRFHHANAGPTQYLALHPLGAWAEYLRGENRRSTESLAELRGRIWVLRVPVSEVLELTYDNAPSHGASAEDLIAEDQIPCRNLAEGWRSDPAAPKVFSAPSAALPGTLNLVVLGPRNAVPYLAEVVDLLMSRRRLWQRAQPPVMACCLSFASAETNIRSSEHGRTGSDLSSDSRPRSVSWHSAVPFGLCEGRLGSRQPRHRYAVRRRTHVVESQGMAEVD